MLYLCFHILPFHPSLCNISVQFPVYTTKPIYIITVCQEVSFSWYLYSSTSWTSNWKFIRILSDNCWFLLWLVTFPQEIFQVSPSFTLRTSLETPHFCFHYASPTFTSQGREIYNLIVVSLVFKMMYLRSVFSCFL